jgi:hypothetical protein
MDCVNQEGSFEHFNDPVDSITFWEILESLDYGGAS